GIGHGAVAHCIADGARGGQRLAVCGPHDDSDLDRTALVDGVDTPLGADRDALSGRGGGDGGYERDGQRADAHRGGDTSSITHGLLPSRSAVTPSCGCRVRCVRGGAGQRRSTYVEL